MARRISFSTKTTLKPSSKEKI